MRKAATRTAQVRVNCFGARTDRAGKDNAGSQGWAGARGGKKKGRAKDRMKQTEVRGEAGPPGSDFSAWTRLVLSPEKYE